jgi:glycosyltransferase involved in cell wall biosynthesis
MRFGYLVPEFPGQTHVFFWRELLELERLGAEVQLFSTRKPLARLQVHAWTAEVMARTFYLHPLGLRLFGAFLRIPPLRYLKVLKMIFTAEDLAQGERLRLFLILPHAILLAAELKRRGLTHLHTHFTFRGADVALFATQLAKVGFSISKHGPDCGVGNQRNKWAHAQFGTVITKTMLAELQTSLAGYLPKDLFLLAMGVDVEKFRRSTSYVPPRVGEKVRLFSCGRIDYSKGHDVAVKMALELRRRGIPVELRIAGSISPGAEYYQAELDALVGEHRLQGEVKFLGGISEIEILHELSEAHAFVLASRSEPLGVVYMEAMAMEVPTIATNAGGVPELIEDRVTGLLIPLESPEGAADAVEWLLGNTEALATMTKAARAFIEANYQAKSGAQKLLSAIRRSAQA